MLNKYATIFLAFSLFAAGTYLSAQVHDHHDHGAPVTAAPDGERPKVFLDKNRRIVDYQLSRLDNSRLLLVERHADDVKYEPVYAAILTRAAMSPQYREEALQGLVQLHRSDAVAELLAVLTEMKQSTRQEQLTAQQLVSMLLAQGRESLHNHQTDLEELANSPNAFQATVAMTSLIVAEQPDLAWSIATQGDAQTLVWLRAIAWVPAESLRNQARRQIVQILELTSNDGLRQAAVNALAHVTVEREDTFRLLASRIDDDAVRDDIIRTLLTIPAEQRDPALAKTLVEWIVARAEQIPAAERTTDAFLDALQLTDQLLARLPAAQARRFRDRLRQVTVRVVKIHTVKEEMRYDTPYFAVEAGRAVQVVIENRDLMPHNFVVTVPGALQEVAELGLAVGPNNGFEGKAYVPESDKVLHATQLIQPGQKIHLTFDAPREPGEYPYVCTFPRHWMRMYGVIVVVPDLDAWNANPQAPQDPVGSNRPFVKSWQLADLETELPDGLRGRTREIGERIFDEATCAQCHRVKDKGGRVGPELTDVFTRYKGDAVAVLREVLEPSHRIDDQYVVQLIMLADGQTISGIVQTLDKKSVTVLVNPESTEPTVIAQSDIEEMVKTSVSMMPKALLDRFTQDEIFELLAFLQGSVP